MKIKRIYSSLLSSLLVFSFCGVVNAQETPINDSIVNFRDAERVVVIENSQGSIIDVVHNGMVYRSEIVNPNSKPGKLSFSEFMARLTSLDEDNPVVGGLKRKKSERDNKDHGISDYIIIQGFGLGFDWARNSTDSRLNVASGKSFELDWLYALGYQKSFGDGSQMLTMGVGFNWRNYQMSDGWCFTTYQGVLNIADGLSDRHVRSSNFHLFSMQAPILWNQALPIPLWDTRLELTGGPILTYTPSASVKTVSYGMEDDKRVDKFAVQNIRKFSVDLFGAVKVVSLGSFYVRYSPQGIMRSEAPLNFNPLTVGFMFGW